MKKLASITACCATALLFSSSAFAFTDSLKKMTNTVTGNGAINISGTVHGTQLMFDKGEDVHSQLTKLQGMNFKDATATLYINGKEVNNKGCSLSVGKHDLAVMKSTNIQSVITFLSNVDYKKGIEVSKSCFSKVKMDDANKFSLDIDGSK